MKITINVFLLKEGRSIFDALSDEVRLQPIQFSLGGVDCLFYHQETPSRPKWTQLFKDVPEVVQLDLTGRSLKALLVMEIQGRVFCFTFGHARHLIDGLGVERYFGLRTALSLTDPLLIKSVEKSSIDRTPLRSKAQSAKHLSISEFDFKFDSEILKSLTGVVESDQEGEYVSGSDSLALHSDVQLDEFPEIASRLLVAYEDERCKEKYPWMDFIVPVRDAVLVGRLDELLVVKINAQEFDQVRAAAPTLLSDDISGFGYVRHRARALNGPVISFDLDLRQALLAKNILGAVSLSSLTSENVYLYGSDEQQCAKWPIYDCLEAEVEFENRIYLLSEGDWYQLDRDYTEQVNRYFDTATISDLEFPRYGTDHEGAYLRRIADSINFYLLDQKLIRLSGASSSFEFCDLLTPDHRIIHVKKYSSSSVLSHLFSQAYVSAEALVNAPEVVVQVNEHLAQEGEFQFTFDSASLPRNKIVFAIMQANERLHIPFFSKVNFRQFAQRLTAMGYQVEICRIAS
ncbi:TIGR04141 family sporadically distributed protein [Pseudomonas aeruginosa]|uniref:TIGR04141 family sporadically distributed protein n=1 Tax=Pseudomonas aeruginosa TaxID=287 RepID=UPI00149604C0|nr:TIGR04141 family sporadically distributed protein [Pseudomonas aeruginosa]MEC6484442.1 TIGR04141 family sporadically distributed protein [Pseudomonas aeruginosa]NPT01247.1 TIGR04141 family sporadically distributed protein [Pseudomonas aeruginosa]QKE96200.1 TIGR04141 family sporadically distributed protein [Pseudomonas aeruginosa]HBO1303759.1 TIGR04141 family sporadically distributed protein [Pseudomonas aeruginosa]HBO6774063.1 sporadically distributed protein, TIGR04141 family [Pseudomonas 